MEVNEQTTAVIDIRPDLDQGIAALKGSIGSLLDYVKALSVDSQEDVTKATEELTIIANLKKELTATQREWTRPIVAYRDSILGVFKSVEAPLLEADQLLRGKVLAYQAQVRKDAEEAERIRVLEEQVARDKAALNGTPAVAVEAVAVPTPQPTTKGELGDSGQVMITKYRVEDFGKLPDKYKLPNDTLIGKLVRAGETDIPGVLIWKELTLAIRAKKSTGKM